MLELLALPLDDEHRARRAEGLLGVRNILWAVGGGGAAAVAGGFTREDFMNEAFLRMTAVEQVSNLIYLFRLYLHCYSCTHSYINGLILGVLKKGETGKK